jgi:hypothetical protein
MGWSKCDGKMLKITRTGLVDWTICAIVAHRLAFWGGIPASSWPVTSLNNNVNPGA